MSLKARLDAQIAQLEGEIGRIVQRKDAEIAACQRQIATLKAAQAKLVGDPELALLVDELNKAGLWPRG